MATARPHRRCWIAPALAAAVALAGAEGRAQAPGEPRARRDCAFSLLVFCLLDSEARTDPPTRYRLEALAGYRWSNYYFGEEIRACRQAGCRLDFTGPSGALDLAYNLAGNPHGDDYWDLGMSLAYMPLVTIRDNRSGFPRPHGAVAPGDGALGYLSVRLTLRRPSFFSLFGSKYLISAFGAGVAVPLATGQAGRSFTGAGEAHFTLGGRLGLQLPVTPTTQIGVATHWNVIWHGPDVLDFAILTALGLDLAHQF